MDPSIAGHLQHLLQLQVLLQRVVPIASRIVDAPTMLTHPVSVMINPTLVTRKETPIKIFENQPSPSVSGGLAALCSWLC